MKTTKTTGAQSAPTAEAARPSRRRPGSQRSLLETVRKWPSFAAATLKQIRVWQSKGYDFSSEEALVACLQTQQRDVENIKLPPDEVRSQTAVEKLLKTRAERMTKELELQAMKGEYIHKRDHDVILSRLGLRTKQACQRIITEPPNWSGLQPTELSKRGRAIFEEISKELENAGGY